MEVTYKVIVAANRGVIVVIVAANRGVNKHIKQNNLTN